MSSWASTLLSSTKPGSTTCVTTTPFCASTISTWPPSCGLVAKVPNLQLYRGTTHGQRAMAAALAIHNTTYPTAIIAA